jgi:hypothetical protein
MVRCSAGLRSRPRRPRQSPRVLARGDGHTAQSWPNVLQALFGSFRPCQQGSAGCTSRRFLVAAIALGRTLPGLTAGWVPEDVLYINAGDIATLDVAGL